MPSNSGLWLDEILKSRWCERLRASTATESIWRVLQRMAIVHELIDAGERRVLPLWPDLGSEWFGLWWRPGSPVFA
jgi:hypothetical protein